MEEKYGLRSSFRSGNGRSMVYMIVLAIGILILLMGVLLGNIRGVIHQPDWNSDEYDGYETTTRWLGFFSGMIINVGMIIVGCGSIIAGFFSARLPPALRAGLVVAGGLVLGLRFG
jgi:hypothetical protein